jgi:hypothetical protein
MRRDVAFFKPWMCSRCGYLMDCTDAVRGPPKPPREGDLAVCMNCGMPYYLRAGAWHVLTAAELATLTMEERRELALAQLSQARAGLPDMSKRGGRA